MVWAYSILGLCLFLMLYTYLLFPVLTNWQAQRSGRILHRSSARPRVSVLMAAHNEEAVLAPKIESVLESDYDLDLITLYIGDDQSTDSTSQIIADFASRYDGIVGVKPAERMGKPAMINLLAGRAIEEHGKDQIFVLTDANVIFSPQNISELVAYNCSENIGLVASNVKFVIDPSAANVATTENTYNEGELKLKHSEGLIWGTMMGPFGACFSVRADLWREVPSDFIVDDFWTNMSVLQQGAKTMLSTTALSYENITGNASTEYRRKVRMSMGNLQNLNYFRSLLFSDIRGLSLSFWSHKVLRWFTPFLMITAYLLMWYIYLKSDELKTLLIVVHIVLLLCLIDPLLARAGWKTGPLRAVRHFILMNIAMLQGYIKYWSGGAHAIWKPTERQ